MDIASTPIYRFSDDENESLEHILGTYILDSILNARQGNVCEVSYKSYIISIIRGETFIFR